MAGRKVWMTGSIVAGAINRKRGQKDYQMVQKIRAQDRTVQLSEFRRESDNSVRVRDQTRQIGGLETSQSR